MSDTETTEVESAEEAPLPVKVIRSVTPEYLPRPNQEMGAIGWMMILGLIVLFLPFLPILVLVWAISEILDGWSARRH